MRFPAKEGEEAKSIPISFHIFSSDRIINAIRDN